MKENNRTDGLDSQTCGHIGPQAPLTPRKIGQPLATEIVSKLRRLRAEGDTVQQLAARFSLNEATVREHCREELTPRKIRGWKGLRAPSAETVQRGHEASGRAFRQKCIGRKLDEVLGPVEEDES